MQVSPRSVLTRRLLCRIHLNLDPFYGIFNKFLAGSFVYINSKVSIKNILSFVQSFLLKEHN